MFNIKSPTSDKSYMSKNTSKSYSEEVEQRVKEAVESYRKDESSPKLTGGPKSADYLRSFYGTNRPVIGSVRDSNNM